MGFLLNILNIVYSLMECLLWLALAVLLFGSMVMIPVSVVIVIFNVSDKSQARRHSGFLLAWIIVFVIVRRVLYIMTPVNMRP